MTNWLINISLTLSLVGALAAAIWFWARDNFKKDIAEDSAKDARKDADIANEPSLGRNGVLEWLRNISRKP